jgi:hypothetical protein
VGEANSSTWSATHHIEIETTSDNQRWWVSVKRCLHPPYIFIEEEYGKLGCSFLQIRSRK